MNKARTTNIGLAIWRLKCFYEAFVQGSTAGILLNFCAKNPPHRQAENRYRQAEGDSTNCIRKETTNSYEVKPELVNAVGKL
jgi:hypothetical protein